MTEHFVQIRLTPEHIITSLTDFNDFISRLTYRLKGFTKKGMDDDTEWTIRKQVIGYETKDKYGRETKPHYHINVIVISNKTQKQMTDLIRVYLRGNGAKGNDAYSVKVLVDPDDEERWLRYPMKEGNYTSKGIDNHEQLAMLAADERKKQIKENLKSEEIQRNKNQFRDKMYKHLDKIKVTGTANIMKAIFNFYNDNGRDAPLPELSNKAFNYEIQRKHRSIDFIIEIDKNQNYYIQ